MKRRVVSTVGLTAILVAALTLSCARSTSASSTLGATSPDYDKGSLKGLSGIRVIVEGIKSDSEADGLKHDDIQVDVELRLRQSGIRVLSKDEWLQAPGGPYLYVNINSGKRDTGLYAYSIDVQLTQAVMLVRDHTILVFASTWRTGSVGTVGANNLRQVRDFVKDHVDAFINDYLAANPPAARPAGNTTRLPRPGAKPVATTGKIASSECATCSGSTPCHACTNCRYCRHCAKDGGSCGICRKPAQLASAAR